MARTRAQTAAAAKNARAWRRKLRVSVRLGGRKMTGVQLENARLAREWRPEWGPPLEIVELDGAYGDVGDE